MLRYFFHGIAQLPLSFLYAIAEFAAFLSYYIFRYRKKTVRSNLERSFPEKSTHELKKIEISFHKQFFQVWVETLKGFGFDKHEILKRVDIKGIELLNRHLEKNETAILMSGHVGNWEWTGSAISSALAGQFTVLFKPIKSQVFNGLMGEIRSGSGIKVVSKDAALRYLLKSKNQPQIIGIINDQNPSKGADKYWLHFLNQETPFYAAAEKFSKAMEYPVYYADMKRVKKGYYHTEIIKLSDGGPEISLGEVLKKYVTQLEATITANPSDYLWSHKRWKYTKEEAAKVTGKPFLFVK